MATARTAQDIKALTKINRKKLDEATAAKMAGRILADGYRPSRLCTDFLLAEDEAILHVVGDAHVRAIFIEYFDRTFKLYSVDARPDILEGMSLDTASFNFVFTKPTLFEARNQFLKMEFYFFGYCISKADIRDLTDRFSKDMLSFKEFDADINAAFSHLIECDDPLDKHLSLFDVRKAQKINHSKTKYDQFLEAWNQPLIWDFSAIKDKDAGKVLQLLKHYLKGGSFGRFLSGKWKLHHCEEIANVLAKYSKLTFLEAPIHQKQPIKRNDDSVSDLLDYGDEMELIPLHEDLAAGTVESVLKTLQLEIIHSTNTEIKIHGDLYNLLQVVKDYTGIDYFALPAVPVPDYMAELTR